MGSGMATMAVCLSTSHPAHVRSGDSAIDGTVSVGHIHTVPRTAAKITVSVDQAVLRQAERVRRRTGESRSALVARALRVVLQVDDNAELVRQYVAGYRRIPETAADKTSAHKLAARALDGLKWESS